MLTIDGIADILESLHCKFARAFWCSVTFADIRSAHACHAPMLALNDSNYVFDPQRDGKLFLFCSGDIRREQKCYMMATPNQGAQVLCSWRCCETFWSACAEISWCIVPDALVINFIRDHWRHERYHFSAHMPHWTRCHVPTIITVTRWRCFEAERKKIAHIFTYCDSVSGARGQCATAWHSTISKALLYMSPCVDNIVLSLP